MRKAVFNLMRKPYCDVEKAPDFLKKKKRKTGISETLN